MVVSIKEYEKLQIKESRNLAQKQISKADAQHLQSLIIDDVPVFTPGNRCLIAQHWVGVIDLPDFSVEILPKIAGFHSNDELRRILVRMLLISDQNPSTKKLPGTVAADKDSLVEVLIDAFLNRLDTYVKTGLLRSYEKVEKNINLVKGRILFNKQFSRFALSPTKFYCRYSRYIQDNPMNQFFKTCLLEMKSVSRNKENRQAISRCLAFFEDISAMAVQKAISTSFAFNSTNAIAKEPYSYGALFLKHYSTTLNSGITSVNVLLFDMNKLFELFIFKVARQAFGHRVQYQSTGHYLVESNTTKKHYINLRPDLMLKLESGKSVVIDTKWKIPTSFAKENDVYQMNAYSSSLPHIQKVYLLYPESPHAKSLEGEYSFRTASGEARELGIRTINLAGCLNWRQFVESFPTIFE